MQLIVGMVIVTYNVLVLPYYKLLISFALGTCFVKASFIIYIRIYLRVNSRYVVINNTGFRIADYYYLLIDQI